MMKRHFTKALCDESGQVMPLTILCMTILLGFVTFVVDVGILLHAKRELQTAVDSAALAGAAEIAYGDVTSAAQTDAAQNGVVNGSINGNLVTVVTVNNGPLNGPHVGNPGYVEVIASQPEPTFFMKMFNQGSMVVWARAVATTVPSSNAIYTLSSTQGITMSNGGTLNAPTAGIVVNATGSNAISMTPDASIQARSVGVVGGVCGGCSIVPTPIVGLNPAGDPLSYLTPPAFDPASCVPEFVNADASLGPSTPGGTVCYSSLQITGSGTITLAPGMYVINGGMSLFNVSGTMTGSGVTFFFPPGASYDDHGGESLNLSAPTSGLYTGVLFYQDPGNTQTMQFIGGSTVNLSGIFYLPTAELAMTAGQSSSTLNVSMVVGSLLFTGNAPFPVTPYVSVNGSSPLLSAKLTEGGL